MNFYFHPEAEAEFSKAIAYYEENRKGLGENFSLEVFASILNILSYASSWPVLEDSVRRCLVNRFPFGILYSIESDEIFILAVMHLNRHPDYWKNRL